MPSPRAAQHCSAITAGSVASLLGCTSCRRVIAPQVGQQFERFLTTEADAAEGGGARREEGAPAAEGDAPAGVISGLVGWWRG